MPVWSRRATREGALQKTYDEAYNSSLQSILRESNQEFHAALDSWKQTLENLSSSMATVDLAAVRHGQEKSLLANIHDIEKQCNERIGFLETRLFNPSASTTNPYGTGAQSSASSLSLPPKAVASVSRVAVGSKSSVPPSPPAHATPPMPSPKDMPYSKYSTSPSLALPRRAPPVVPIPRASVQSQPALHQPALAQPFTERRRSPSPHKEYTLRSKKVPARSSNSKSSWLSSWGRSAEKSTESSPQAAPEHTHVDTPTSHAVPPRTESPRPEQPRPNPPPSPKHESLDRWADFTGAHMADTRTDQLARQQERSHSPVMSSITAAAPVAAPAAPAQPRKTNRYVVTKSVPPVRNGQFSNHALTAASLTAARQSQSSARTASPTNRRSARPVAVSASSRGTSKRPSSEPTKRNQSSDGEPEEEEHLDEWDLMAREKIKTLRGVDENAAKQILNEVVLKGDPVHWGDIAGLDRAKASLKETVVYPFLRPDLFSGLREPALGMLLFGPPGTGKTMLARAVATESKSTFFSISASSLTSKYMGESEKLVRALFQMAKALAPSIIFVDEIDSILTQRSDSGEHEASRRIKNEFLVQWSDLQAAAAGKQSADSNSQRVLVLGATNLPWAIDEAARRRFVRRQYIPLPEAETRDAHLHKLLSHQKHALSEEDIARLRNFTEGYSGSDLTALAKDAAMGPLRSLGDDLLTTDPDKIRPMNMTDFEQSMQTIRPSVSPEGLQAFEQWALLYGSSGA